MTKQDPVFILEKERRGIAQWIGSTARLLAAVAAVFVGAGVAGAQDFPFGLSGELPSESTPYAGS